MPSEKQKMIVTATLVAPFLLYSICLYSSLPVKKNTISDEAGKGKLVWQQYNCNACHQVYGLGGYLGPDLTNVYSLKGPEYIMAFLKNGTATMPDFHLSTEEMNTILSYLKNIDSSGKSDPRTFRIKSDGTIEQ